MLGAQATNFVVDQAGLHRAAARAIDAQDDTSSAFIVKSGFQRVVDVLGAGLALRLDGAIEMNERRVLAIGQFSAAPQSTSRTSTANR
jgi:hypothetical protein